MADNDIPPDVIVVHIGSNDNVATYNDLGVISKLHQERGGTSTYGNNVYWTLEDFFNLPQTLGTQIQSPRFMFNGSPGWMEIYPNGCRKFKSGGWLGMSMGGCFLPEHFSVRLGIVDENREEIFSCVAPFSESFNRFSLFKFISRSDFELQRDKMVPGGKLCVSCEISIIDPGKGEASLQPEADAGNETAAASEEMSATPGETSLLAENIIKLKQERRELLLSGRNSDITLKIINREFKAHRNILAARSPVFSTRLERSSTIGSTIRVKDIDPGVFEDFLHYLYIEDVEDLTLEKVWSLYDAAERYRVDGLKELCVQQLIDSFSVQNFHTIMRLCFRKPEEKLFSAAAEFFAEKGPEILESKMGRQYPLQPRTAYNRLIARALSL